MVMVAGLLLALLAVLIVLEPLLRGAGASAEPVRVLLPDSDDEVDPAQRRRDLALAALKEIEFDQATGKLSDEDYAALNAKYSAEALEALREADVSGGNGRDGSVRAPAAADDAALERLIADARAAGVAKRRFCIECGNLLGPAGKFCNECGAGVPA